MKLGNSITNIRKQKGLKQDELASKSKISTTYLSQIENDRKKLNIDTLERISQALEMPLPILFFLSLELDDVPDEKKQIFTSFFPPFESFIKELFI